MEQLERTFSGAYKRSSKNAGFTLDTGVFKRVLNSRRTFGRKRCGAVVPLKTPRSQLGLATGDIATYFQAAELNELTDAA